MTWGHQYNWLILIALSVAGALIRVFFVQRHKGKASPVPVAVAAVLIMGIAAAIVPRPSVPVATDSIASNAEVFARVQGIVQERCTGCHANVPSQPGFSAPPKGIVLETDEDIVRLAQTIHQQSVVTRAMPIGNLTQITDDERALIDQWYLAGAQSE
jgi:uncharacterized membrane protein